MELKDLVGNHKLSGVDQLNVKKELSWGDEDCQAIRFVLDGVTYIAIEDPSDGYRSAMDEIKTTTDPVTVNFAPVDVVCSMRTKGEFGGEDEVLELRDVQNGKLVLEVGTADVDDYYPGFVCNWTPENLAINEGK